MSGRPRKRSLTLKGHRTSVSLEDEFWRAFLEIAKEDHRGINDLAAEIDAARDPGVGLATAMRLFVFGRIKSRSGETPPGGRPR